MKAVPLVLCATLAAAASEAATIDERVDRLLGRMTLEQRIRQLTQDTVWSTAEEPALAIPGLDMSDGPHGVARDLATSFPVGVAMAASFDEDLVRRIGEAIGREMRGRLHNQGLGPCIDLLRDPRAGRAAETAGEDPWLGARVAAAFVAGLQGTSCIATPKHLALNTRESARSWNDYAIDDRTLIEYYGEPFRAAVQEAGSWSLMNAYNLINGDECSESRHLLTEVLRRRWGHFHYVVSDWNAVTDAERAIEAGTDLETSTSYFRDDLADLVLAGRVAVDTVETAVRRVLRAKLASGLIDGQPLADTNDVDSPAHRQLAREAAHRSIVLLKNERGVLPLDPASLGSIALVGPSADLAQLDGQGSSNVNPFYAFTPLQGLRSRLGPGVTVRYAQGCSIAGGGTAGFAEAIQAAASSDAVVFVGGLDRSREGEDRDRVGNSIDLPGVQCDLIRALAAANPRLVVVLEGGGPIGVGACIDAIPALLYAFYPGQEGGNAIADVLIGAVNPSGKLPYTIPKSDGQLPPWELDHRRDLVDGRGYRWFDAQGLEPEFPFGHGLSYTSFLYEALVIEPAVTPLGQPVLVSVEVTNAGSRAGEEVVQLYVEEPECTLPTAPRQLKGFRRVALGPGERRTVSFTIEAEELYHFDPTASGFAAQPGRFTVWTASSSRDLRLGGQLELVPAAALPDLTVLRVSSVPPFPEAGDDVNLMAVLRNQGTAPTPEGVLHEVAFSIDGQPAALSTHHTGSILPGEIATLLARGPDGAIDWRAAAAGSFALEAVADPADLIAETLEGNNVTRSTLVVRERNLAAQRPTRVSAVAWPGAGGRRAVDDVMTTRWASGQVDPQFLEVDLGRRVTLHRVELAWAEWPASDYRIEVSDDGQSWSTLFRQRSGDGGIDVVPIAGAGRWLRLTLLARDGWPGYSLLELQAFGAPLEPLAEEAGNCGDGADNDGNGSTDCDDPACAGGPGCDAVAIDRRVLLTPTGSVPALAAQFDPWCRYGRFRICPEVHLPAAASPLRLTGEGVAGGAPSLWLYERSGDVRLRLVKSRDDLVLRWE